MQVLKLPKSGKAMEEGTVTEWQVNEGDPVYEGDTVVIIEADKSAVEVTAEQEGVILDIGVPEGETVPVGTELGRIGSPDKADRAAVNEEPDETADSDRGRGPAINDAETTSDVTRQKDASGSASTTADAGETENPVRATPTARRIARERGVSLDEVMGGVVDGISVRPEHIKSISEKSEDLNSVDRTDVTDAADSAILGSPYARVVANERGVSIAAVGETFGTDRVREAHINHYIEEYGTDDASGTSRNATVTSEIANPDKTVAVDEPAVLEKRALDGAAEVMYDRMGQVAREYASTTTVQKVDVTKLIDLYDRLAPVWEQEGDSLSLTAFVVRAVAQTLPKYRELNAEHMDKKMLCIYEDVNVGIAVDSDRGLVVPTIFDSNEYSLRDLTTEIDRLAKRARAGELNPDEMQNGTFTVSNAGSLGAYMNTPQINPPQTGILGICEVFDEPSIIDDDVVSCKKMHLCLTYDHRVIDGATAVGFLSDITDTLEQPEKLLS